MSTGLNKPKRSKRLAESDASHHSRQVDFEPKVIIFDFDGTLADVVPIFFKIYDQLRVKYGMRDVTPEDYERLRKKPIWRVMLKVGLKPWRFPGLLHDGRVMFAKYKNKVEMFGGTPRMIQELHAEGHKLYILSSNSESTIRNILRRYDLNDEVKVMKRPKFFGKAGSISNLIAKNHYNRKNVWMIGDEVRDIKAGKGARVNTIAVTWGLQAKEILETKNPTFIASNVDQLKDYLLK